MEYKRKKDKVFTIQFHIFRQNVVTNLKKNVVLLTVSSGLKFHEC